MFKEISINDLQFNPFDKIASQWMLISAGDEKAFNTMTASWGAALYGVVLLQLFI